MFFVLYIKIFLEVNFHIIYYIPKVKLQSKNSLLFWFKDNIIWFWYFKFQATINLNFKNRFTAVIKVFIFQSEKVPDESSNDFQRWNNGHNQISMDKFRFGQRQRNGPQKAQYKVLRHGKVIIWPENINSRTCKLTKMDKSYQLNNIWRLNK